MYLNKPSVYKKNFIIYNPARRRRAPLYKPYSVNHNSCEETVNKSALNCHYLLLLYAKLTVFYIRHRGEEDCMLQ